MVKINKNIASVLEMDLPEELETNENYSVTIVNPSDIPSVDNPNLPDMHDTDRAILESENQLEVIINKGMNMINQLYDDLSGIEPRYRNRQIEVISGIMNNTLNAVIHKSKLQIEKKKVRLVEADFKLSNGNGNGNENSGFIYVGSREEFRKSLTDLNPPQVVEDDNSK